MSETPLADLQAEYELTTDELGPKVVYTPRLPIHLTGLMQLTLDGGAVAVEGNKPKRKKRGPYGKRKAKLDPRYTTPAAVIVYVDGPAGPMLVLESVPLPESVSP